MAYTLTDLADVQAAIVTMGKGLRPTQVSSGDKMIKYGEMSHAELKALEADIKIELAAAGSTPVFRTYAKQGGSC